MGLLSSWDAVDHIKLLSNLVKPWWKHAQRRSIGFDHVLLSATVLSCRSLGRSFVMDEMSESVLLLLLASDLLRLLLDARPCVRGLWPSRHCTQDPLYIIGGASRS